MNERETDSPTSTSDVKHFVEEFKKSAIYEEGFTNYYQDKKLHDDVSEEDKNEVFLSSNEAVSAIVDFNTKSLNLKYDPDSLPSDSRNAVEKYIHIVDSQLSVTTRDQIAGLDTLRTMAHNDTATALIEDKLCNHFDIAKAVARLILVDLDLESNENVKIMKKRYITWKTP